MLFLQALKLKCHKYVHRCKDETRYLQSHNVVIVKRWSVFLACYVEISQGFFLLFSQQFITKIALDRRGSHGWTRVLLKGQMRYIADIDAIVFLCSPL